MTLLRTSAKNVAGIAHPDSLVEQLLEQMLFTTGRRASEAEQKSWGRSLPVFARDLVDAGLGDVEMLVEYHLPLTSQRADVVLAGIHPDTGAPSYMVVELKQWSSAYRFEDSPELVEVPGVPGGPALHPVAQVKGYCDYLGDFAKAVADQPDALAGMAYLHNATDPSSVADLRSFPTSVTGRLFTAADRDDMALFLRSRLSTAAAGHAAGDPLMRSAVAPSQQLLKVAAAEVRDRPQFHLLGNQQLAVDLVLHAVEQARSADSKRVVVVTGGPGSGKSVIALSLVGELARRGRTVLHATGSRSFTQTLRKVAGYRAPRVQKMFKYLNQFITAERNGLDVLVLDEAHRIRETSVDRYTRAELRTDRPQIDELIAAARVPVFRSRRTPDRAAGARWGRSNRSSATPNPSARGAAPAVGRAVSAAGGSEEYVLWVKRLLARRRRTGPVERRPSVHRPRRRHSAGARAPADPADGGRIRRSHHRRLLLAVERRPQDGTWSRRRHRGLGTPVEQQERQADRRRSPVGVVGRPRTADSARSAVCTRAGVRVRLERRILGPTWSA